LGVERVQANTVQHRPACGYIGTLSLQTTR